MVSRTATDLDFLAANIHGRRSRLAEADRLDALCRIRTVPELARALFPESQFLTAVHLQRVLVMDLAEELSTIASKIAGASGALLDWLRVRFQMENLKVLVRGFSTGMPLADLQPYLVPLPDDLALNLEALAAADSLETFAAAVEPPRLREGLAKAVEIYGRQPKPFFPEAGLDWGYLEELLARARALGESHRAEVLPIAQQEADTFHLMLVTRGRFVYGLKPEVLRPFHVSRTHITPERFGRMVEAADMAEAASAAVGAAIDALPPEASGKTLDAAVLEVLAWNRYYRLANRTFRASHMGLGAVVAYASIRRIELANLITLTEGLRTQMAPDAIRRRLIPQTRSEAARV